MRKNYNRAIHKADFRSDNGLQYVTVCEKTSRRSLRTSDWDKVTCKKCLPSQPSLDIINLYFNGDKNVKP